LRRLAIWDSFWYSKDSEFENRNISTIHQLLLFFFYILLGWKTTFRSVKGIGWDQCSTWGARWCQRQFITVMISVLNGSFSILLDCRFLIDPSLFWNVYLRKFI
jgi:hypothetical protein